MITNIRDEKVKEKTGKVWDEWFAFLDDEGAMNKTHKEIAKFLVDECELAPWWGQMVTVVYERARGRREVHQTSDGDYQCQITKVVPLPKNVLFNSFMKDTIHHGQFSLMKSTPPKSLRFCWKEKDTSVDVLFYSKGEKKTQVVIEHRKLKSSKEVSSMKKYWKDKLQEI